MTTVPSAVVAAAPPTWARWLLAIRPKTLAAAVVPVAVGTALADAMGGARLGPALAALAGALLIQVGTNLTNDYYDFVRGADTAARIGPRRVTQQGLIPPRRVLGAAFVAFGGAALVGVYLIARGGWPIAIAGFLSLLSGYAYTGGPWPLGYHGLGDVFVFVFFGLVAVAGTFYVQVLRLGLAPLLAGCAVGALATSLLAVNNLRDAATDAVAHKRTLVVRLGTTAGRIEWFGMVALAFLVPVALWGSGLAPAAVLLSLAALPVAFRAARLVLEKSGGHLDEALGATAGVMIAFGAFLCAGLEIGHRWHP